MAYPYKTEPLGKQRQVIEDNWHRPAHALLCRPGTGKSKMCIDHAGHLFLADKIRAMIIIAPNNVHTQWVAEALPKHMSDGVAWSGGAYHSRIGKTALNKLRASLNVKDTLRVLAVSFEGLQTPTGKELVQGLLREHSGATLVVVDESHRVSNTKAAGYKAVFKIVRQASFRRIATGTLLRQNPFSAYGQFELLGHNLLGFGSLAAFKSMFAEMLPKEHGLVKRIAKDFKEKTGRTIHPQIQARDADDRPIYKNLGFLRQRLAEWSSFMTLQDVSGTEPIVMASTRFVRMTIEQRRLYDDLQQHGIADAPNGELTVDGTLALSLRLAQIVGGFMPSDDDPQAQPVQGDNPKMDELRTILEELGDEKIIVWCKFKAELLAVAAALREQFEAPGVVAEYHGDVPQRQRDINKTRFAIDPTCRYFVAQPKAGGTGLDGLQLACRYMVFYSNDYSYTDREQAVSRLARTGGSHVVNTIDLMAEDSIDLDIVKCMQSAEDVHEKVLRRAIVRKWF